MKTITPQVRKSFDIPLLLSDGVTLFADIYKPAQEGEYPVLLMRQPYGRKIASTVVYAPPEYFAKRGFIVVIQDVRGRGDSEGVFEPFVHEEKDGLETLEWVASLEESNGRVGMYGFSYQAYTQLAVLKKKPSCLRAIAPHMSAANLYQGWFYQNGLLKLNTTVAWGTQMMREDAWRMEERETAFSLENAYANLDPLFTASNLLELSPLTDKGAPSYFADWIEHDTEDAYWQKLDCSQAVRDCDIPIFHLAGYYDFYAKGTELLYQHAACKERDLFVLAPWKHIPWERWMCGVDFGKEVMLDINDLLAQWFHAHLQEDTACAPSGCQYFVMGENRWQHAPVWPPAQEAERILYLHAESRANSLFGNGILCDEVRDNGEDSFCYEPLTPVSSPSAYGPVDLKEQQQSNSLLVYTSNFEESLVVAGNIQLRLFVQSTAAQTAIVARLSLVEKNGTARFLGLTCGVVHFYENDPLEIQEVALSFDALAFAIAKEQQIRLDLASSSFPWLARHPNNQFSPAKVPIHRDYQIAKQTILHGKDAPSSLYLPVTQVSL